MNLRESQPFQDFYYMIRHPRLFWLQVGVIDYWVLFKALGGAVFFLYLAQFSQISGSLENASYLADILSEALSTAVGANSSASLWASQNDLTQSLDLVEKLLWLGQIIYVSIQSLLTPFGFLSQLLMASAGVCFLFPFFGVSSRALNFIQVLSLGAYSTWACSLVLLGLNLTLTTWVLVPAIWAYALSQVYGVSWLKAYYSLFAASIINFLGLLFLLSILAGAVIFLGLSL